MTKRQSPRGHRTVLTVSSSVPNEARISAASRPTSNGLCCPACVASTCACTYFDRLLTGPSPCSLAPFGGRFQSFQRAPDSGRGDLRRLEEGAKTRAARAHPGACLFQRSRGDFKRQAVPGGKDYDAMAGKPVCAPPHALGIFAATADRPASRRGEHHRTSACFRVVLRCSRAR